MSNDRVKIILESWQGPDPLKANTIKTHYRVRKLANTTRWNIGQMLEKPEVDDIIEVLRYNVEIVERIFD